jgi:hypothetical protein
MIWPLVFGLWPLVFGLWSLSLWSFGLWVFESLVFWSLGLLVFGSLGLCALLGLAEDQRPKTQDLIRQKKRFPFQGSAQGNQD